MASATYLVVLTPAGARRTACLMLSVIRNTGNTGLTPYLPTISHSIHEHLTSRTRPPRVPQRSQPSPQLPRPRHLSIFTPSYTPPYLYQTGDASSLNCNASAAAPREHARSPPSPNAKPTMADHDNLAPPGRTGVEDPGAHDVGMRALRRLHPLQLLR